MDSQTADYEYQFLDSPASTESAASPVSTAEGAELLDAYSRAVTDVVQRGNWTNRIERMVTPVANPE